MAGRWLGFALWALLLGWKDAGLKVEGSGFVLGLEGCGLEG